MLMWSLWMPLALGAPTPTDLEEGSFQAVGPAERIVVERLAVPDGVAAAADDRLCRVRFSADVPGPMAPELLDCPPGVIQVTEAAMASWQVTLTREDEEEGEATPTSFEVWVRFGVGAREVPELFVRGHWARELSLPSGVRGLSLHPAELPKPTYPEQALTDGLLGAACTADLEVSHRGYLLSDAVVSGCDPVFAEAVVETAKRWRFKTPRIGQEPSASASTLGVVFETMPGSAPGELDTKVQVVVPGGGEKVVMRQAPRMVKSGIPTNAEPLLVVDHDPYAQVEVMDWVWPDVAVAVETRCELLVQVNSRRQVVVWPEACPDEVVDATVAAVSRWSLRPGEIEPGERYGRFRAAVLLRPDGDPHLVVPEKDVVTVAEDIAERVHTFRDPVTKTRVPPKIPKGMSGPEECVLAVEVSPSGKPSSIEAVSCSEAAFAEAKKAVKQWRWDPAREDGKPLPWSTTVKLKFAG